MTPITIRIRPATADDIPLIMAIERQAAGAAHWSEKEYGRILTTDLLMLAETEGEVAAFICAKHAAGEWELENIAVAPAFQRRGVAGKLLKVLIDHMRQNHASTVFLEVRESNLPARRFYEKQGFNEVGRRRQYYHRPDEDAVLYKLDLGSGLSQVLD